MSSKDDPLGADLLSKKPNTGAPQKVVTAKPKIRPVLQSPPHGKGKSVMPPGFWDDIPKGDQDKPARTYSHSVDWYAVGIFLYELMYGRPPFMAHDPY